MNLKKIYIVLWAIFYFGIMVSGCTMLEDTGMWKKPEAKVSSIELSDLDFESAMLNVIIDVFNPNPYKINMGMLEYSLMVKDNQVLEGQQDKSMSLSAEQSQEIIFPVQMAFQDIFSAVSEIRHENVIQYGLDGWIKFDVPVAGRIKVPFSKKGELPVPKMPKISVKKLKLDNLNLTGATLKLSLAMKNPNHFGVNLNRFDFSLKLNNNTVAQGELSSKLTAGASETSVIDLPLDLSFSNTGLALYNLLQSGGELNYTLSLDGEAGSTLRVLKNFPFQTKKIGKIKLTR